MPGTAPPFPPFHIPPNGEGMRLDAALAFALPNLGLRGRRRLWQWWFIRVNERPRPAGYVISAGDAVDACTRSSHCPAPGMTMRFSHDTNTWETAPAAEALHYTQFSAQHPAEPPPQHYAISIAALSPDFVALCKPAGLHTAHVAASPLPSLEGLLPDIWKNLCAAWRQPLPPRSGDTITTDTEPPLPLLLTRLDMPTSGIILGAFSERMARRFREWEAAGAVEKIYHAVVSGSLQRPLVLDAQLRTNNRRITLVSPFADPDPTRHTHVTPIRPVIEQGKSSVPASFDATISATEAQSGEVSSPATFVHVRIQRGARHQIRAHLAHAGFPLTGDTQYGPASSPFPFYLHHAALVMPQFRAECAAPLIKAFHE